MENYAEKIVELKASFDKKEWVMPEWTDKVLEFLSDNEIAIDPKNNNKYPKVRGLRRIGAYLADGEVKTQVVHVERSSYASCLSTFHGERIQTITSMAEATPENVNHEMIAKHLLATAESRSEGRCWAKVLKLNCLTAEEMSLDVSAPSSPKEKTRDIDESDASLMTDMQRKLINAKSKKLDVNSIKIGEIICQKGSLDVKSHIRDGGLSKELAEKVLEILNSMERGEVSLSDKTKGFVKL